MKSSPSSLGKRSRLGGIAAVALVAIYSVTAPRLNDRFGWNLPALRTDQAGNVQMADSAKPASPPAATARDLTERQPASPSVAKPDPSSSTAAGQTQTGKTNQQRDRLDARPTDTTVAKTSDQSSGRTRYGLLREVSRDRYMSPEGLLYTPGSAEGHRLEHLRRHTKDDPRRPGSHGVFDGDMEGALRTVDRAYARAKKDQRTTKRVDGDRTIYTVDMGGRVGFVGGRDGNRKRKPMARRVRLVLEGNRVITAYPL